MTLKEIYQKGSSLEKILCIPYTDIIGNVFASVAFQFKDTPHLCLGVDGDTDELFWSNDDDEKKSIFKELDCFIPSVKNCYGMHLAWSWEMENQQGYFDALQLEFMDLASMKGEIIQFKAMGSGIHVYRIVEE
ncbi:MAG: hypothetical protein LBV12_06665 [Puniceicoccales bacterium]|jgi:hypothetical protein|nr:hypothetical protein [Puniceicoccales bacterium]